MRTGRARGCRTAWRRHSRGAAGSICPRCVTSQSAAVARFPKVGRVNAVVLAVSVATTCVLIALILAAFSAASISMCDSLTACLQWLASCSRMRHQKPNLQTLLACASGCAPYQGSFLLVPSASLTGYHGITADCTSLDATGLSFAAAPGATDGRMTVARLDTRARAFQVMLGVPIRHGVVRWEVLLHRGNEWAIGCTAWPVIGSGPRFDDEMALRNSWMWCPYVPTLLFRGVHGPPGPRWASVLADCFSE